MRWHLLDGARGIAALLVLLSHVAFWTGASDLDTVGPLLARGDAGVAIFFALSSFVLLTPYYRCAWSGGEVPEVPVLRSYAIRRLARIVPAYWAALAAVLLAAALIPNAGGIGDAARVISHVLMVQGYTGETYQSFSQTWSLTTEVTFYLAVPLLGGAIRRIQHTRIDRHLALLALIAGGGLVAQGVAAATTLGALGASVVGHAAWFAVGAAAAALTQAHAANLHPRAVTWGVVLRRDPLLGVLAWMLVFAIVSLPFAGPTDLNAPTVDQAVVKEAGYALLAGLVILTAVVAEQRINWSTRKRELCTWLGGVSYAVFLWHVLVLQVVYALAGRPLFTGGFWWVLALVLGLTVAIASVSAQLLEQPILRRAHAATRP